MRDQKMHNEKLSCKIKLTKKCVQKMSDQKCPTKICHGIPKPMSFCGKKQAEINILSNWIKPPIKQITCIDYSILSPILHHPPTSTHIDICQQHAVWLSSRKRNSVSAESTDIVGELAYGMSQLNYALLLCIASHPNFWNTPPQPMVIGHYAYCSAYAWDARQLSVICPHYCTWQGNDNIGRHFH